MCVCRCICICICLCMRICNKYVHICLYTVLIYVLYMRICIYVYRRDCYVYIYILTHTYIYMYVHTHTYVRTYVRACIHTYIHADLWLRMMWVCCAHIMSCCAWPSVCRHHEIREQAIPQNRLRSRGSRRSILCTCWRWQTMIVHCCICLFTVLGLCSD